MIQPQEVSERERWQRDMASRDGRGFILDFPFSSSISLCVSVVRNPIEYLYYFFLVFAFSDTHPRIHVSNKDDRRWRYIANQLVTIQSKASITDRSLAFVSNCFSVRRIWSREKSTPHSETIWNTQSKDLLCIQNNWRHCSNIAIDSLPLPIGGQRSERNNYLEIPWYDPTIFQVG
jgi:hypothetical protein